MNGTDRHIHIGERDLGEQLPAIAQRMRTIAQDRRNWMVPPRSISGWDETVCTGYTGSNDPHDEPVEGPNYSRVHRTCDGWVPSSLLLEGDGAGAVDPSGADADPWVLVPDLSRYLVARYLLVEHQTRMTITFTVDVPETRPLRHLSLQVTVPGQLTQGLVTGHEAELASMHEGIVLLFFPAAALGSGIGVGVRVGDAWQVIDPNKPKELRAQTWKTPVVFDYVLDHELEAIPIGPKRKVQLYGPDGRPL